ncbi:MAG: GNAT family N-acetyltransferase [Defluviitaleaceae bacterium]|nr:GNAT family N-acetyltransferase [Defluviitaleaceae bacterium]
MNDFFIRPIKPEEIDSVAAFISSGYFDDIFFHWTVDSDGDRHAVVTEYYKVYLRAVGCVAHVAESPSGAIVGATVWLPHNVDAAIYDEINHVVGKYAPRFQAVADMSHESEPPGAFYQLVGFVVDKKARGRGIGKSLLKFHLDILDEKRIPTYLEASTPYVYGKGAYGKFGYKQCGELLVFTENAVLYPLYRDFPRKTAFVCDESYFWHNAGSGALFEPDGGYIQTNGSAESPESKRRVKNLLERSGLFDRLIKIKPFPATEEQLQYFHTKHHVEAVKEYSKIGGIDCGDTTIVGRGSFEIAKLSAGGAITAVKAVVEGAVDNAYVLARPPGHHAEADRGVGYCIFNNIVIAAKYAQRMLGINKIAIIDWDAHHGNGTEDAFYEDDNVLFISLHQSGLDPIGRGQIEHKGRGKGEGYTINIPLYAGGGDAVYRYAFEKIVVPAVEEFSPQLILVSAGQDGNIFDPLARMMLSAQGYRYMARTVKNLADKHAGGKLVCLHEGGYCSSYVPFCSHAIIEELSGITTDVTDPFIYAMEGTEYNELLPHQKERIDGIK